MSLYAYLRNILLALIIIQLLPSIYSLIQDQYGFLFMQPKIRVGKIDIDTTISEAQTYTKQLKDVFKQDDVEAVMLAIDSGGGAAGSAQSIFNDIQKLKQKHNKPVITWVENTCASGAYYIAAASDRIISAPSAFIGSIGVYIPQTQLKKFIEQFNIGYDIVSTGEYKGISSPFLERTERERQLLQGITDDVYHVFTRDITEARSQLKQINTEDWANGKLFTGHQALELGMVDGTGSMLTAEEHIREMTDKEGDITYITPPRPFNLSEFLAQTATQACSYISQKLTCVHM